MDTHSETPDALPAPGRSSRFWLYAPITLLALVAIAWSAAWFYARNRTGEALDAFMTTEAAAGRRWACPERTIGGYPFRVEVVCPSLSLTQGPVSASLGRVESVAQVYQPRFIITEIDGPLQVTDGRTTVRGTWDLLQTSVHQTAAGLQRFSLVSDRSNLTYSQPGLPDLAAASEHLELHLRPNPSRRADNAYDVALSATKARLPFLDGLLGSSDPADLQIDVTATQAGAFGFGAPAEELERWRRAGGTLDILMLSVTQGAKVGQAKGELHLDDLHRPAGQLNLQAAGLDGLIGSLTGNKTTGLLLGALLGQAQPGKGQDKAQAGNQPRLVPLPPLTIANGRLAMGPFALPASVQAPPLY